MSLGTTELAQEQDMTPHKYQIGDTIKLQTPSWNRAAATGSYTVSATFPTVSLGRGRVARH